MLTETEVWSVMRRSKPQKAAGQDNISNEIFINSFPHTIRTYTVQQVHTATGRPECQSSR